MMYQRREWVIQRSLGGDQWEDFPTTYRYAPKTREEMEASVARMGDFYPGDEFRGHNVAWCADTCHAMAFKAGKA